MITKTISEQSLKALIAASLLIFCALGRLPHAATLNTGSSTQNHHAWQRLTSKEDNFSVQIPAQPEIRGRGEFTFGPDGERVSQERIATAYHNGVVYIIRVYEAASPKRLFSKYPKIFRLSGADESSIAVGGFEGKQYLKKGDNFFHFVRLFPAKKRLYVLEAAARAEANPDVGRFLSSLTLGDAGAAESSGAAEVAGAPPANGDSMTLAPSGSKPLLEKEVTRPVVIIHKPQPPYTALAKQNRVSGAIKLRVVLSPSGEVTGIEVLRGLSGGLTEGATEVARSIKFLPAEKDGQLVPQYAEVEYNFVLM